MSRSKKNTTGSVYHISGIKHRVTKRYSSDRVANSKVTHKNIPHPDSKAGAEVTNNAEDPTAGLADYMSRINTRVEHTLSSVSSAYLWYHRLSRKWIQRPLSKSKVDSVPVFECLPELGQVTESELRGGGGHGLYSTLRKLKMPGNELIKSDITLYCSDRRLHTIIGAIPVDITDRGSKGNTSRQLLHIVSELSTLSISKVC